MVKDTIWKIRYFEFEGSASISGLDSEIKGIEWIKYQTDIDCLLYRMVLDSIRYWFSSRFNEYRAMILPKYLKTLTLDWIFSISIDSIYIRERFDFEQVVRFIFLIHRFQRILEFLKLRKLIIKIVMIRGIKCGIGTGLKTSSLSFKRREDAIYVYLCQPGCIIRKLFLDLCDTQDRPESCVGQHKRHILGIIKGGICNHDAEWIILAMVGKILSHGGRTFGMRGLVTLLY